MSICRFYDQYKPKNPMTAFANMAIERAKKSGYGSSGQLAYRDGIYYLKAALRNKEDGEGIRNVGLKLAHFLLTTIDLQNSGTDLTDD